MQITRGESSQEKVTQEQREKTALVAIYLSDSHIPDTPGEATNIVDADEQKDICMMTVGPEVDELFFSSEQAQAQAQEQAPLDFSSVADLVAQLATGNAGNMGMGGVNMNTLTGDAGAGAGGGSLANSVNNSNGPGGMPNSYIVFKPGNVPVVSALNNGILCYMSRSNGCVPTTVVHVAGPSSTAAPAAQPEYVRGRGGTGTTVSGRILRRRSAGTGAIF